MIKRKLSALILTMLLLSSVMLQTAASTKENSDNYIDFLTQVGIINTDFISDKPVSRGELAMYIAALYGEAAAEVTAYDDLYTDVSGEEAFAGAVKQLAVRRVMNGYGDGTFRPQKPVDISEAVKILIHILGYEYQASIAGGYPNGYLITAAKIGLLRGNDADKAYLYGTDAAALLYHALDIDLLKTKGYTQTKNGSMLERLEGEKHSTILNEYLHLYRGKGIVTDSYITNLTGIAVPHSSVRVDGMTMRITRKKQQNLVGYYVDYVYRQEENSSERELIYAKPKEDSYLVVEAEDFSICGKKVSYQNNDREKTALLSEDADLIFNGKKMRLDKTEDDGSFERFVCGQAVLIDNNGDGLYEILSVESYQNIFLQGKNTASVTFYDNSAPQNSVCLDKKLFDEIDLFSADGAELSIDEVSVNSVLTYYQQGNYFKGIVSNMVVEGAVYEIEETGSKKLYRINGRSYQQSAFYGGASFRAGDSVTAYLDVFGCIQEMKISAAKEEKIGFLLQTQRSNDLSGRYEFLIYTAKDEKAVYECAQRIDINGVSTKLKDVPSTFPQGVVMYKLSEEGKIIRLETAVSKENYEEGRLVISYARSEGKAVHYTGNRSFASKIPYDKINTVMFSVKETGGAITENDIKCITYSAFAERESYAIESYHLSAKDDTATALVVYGEVSDKIRSERNMAVLSKNTIRSDDEGDVRRVGTVFVDGEQKTLVFAENMTGAKAEELMTGDVFRYALNNKDEVVKVELLYSVKKGWLSEYNPLNPATAAQTSIGDNPCMAYGKVIVNNGRQLRYMIGENALYTGFLFDCYAFPVTKYDKVTVIHKNGDKCKVSSGKMTDVETGDMIIDYTALFASYGLVVIKE